MGFFPEENWGAHEILATGMARREVGNDSHKSCFMGLHLMDNGFVVRFVRM